MLKQNNKPILVFELIKEQDSNQWKVGKVERRYK
jgi:hypothetical protein